VAAGLIALVRDGAISANNPVGKTYVMMTVLTCLTGFPIVHHGGFGPAHALGMITLAVLAVAAAAAKGWFGRASVYVETVSYSATFFFHMIPTFTETATRFPVGAPLAAGPDAPGLQLAIGLAFIVFVIGATLQLLRLRAKARDIEA
jgi:hypothetical protein